MRAVLAMLVAAAPAPAHITAVGWWSKQPAAMAQPSGGFQVAAGIDGAESVAAIRITAGSVQRVVLKLAEASAIGSPALRVCSTTATWKPANPGSYQDAPPANCAHPVTLVRANDAWTGDVSALVPSGTTADLLIEPVPPAAGQVSPTFTVTVQAATLSATAAPTGPSAPQPPPQALASPPPVAAPAPTATASSIPLPAAAAPLPTPASAPPPTAAPTAPSSIASPVFSSKGIHHTRPWYRLVLFVPIAALCGLAAAGLRRARGLPARPGF